MNPPTPRALAPRLAASAMGLALVLLLSACAGLPGPTLAEHASRDAALAAAPAASIAPAPAPAVAPAQPLRIAELALPHIRDEMQPGVNVDLDDARAKADLWQRMRGGFGMAELDNDLVRRAESWYSERPDYVQRMTERGSRYLYHILGEVEKRGMPAELALLPFVESAFNPQAMSSAKASGMWQFMPATGRDFDLKQNIFRDDRRDVLASTRAALDYLGRLHDMFGDWHLALAAYNWGQGNVSKAIARNQKLGLPTDYESLKMPDETRYYVPKLQAVKNIVLRPESYALSLPPVADHPFFLSVDIDRDIDVDVAARLAGLSVDQFKQFNPQVNKPVMLAAASSQVLLPYDNAGAFARNLAAHQGALASWTAWVLPRTMNPADAARQVGMSEAELRELNKIPPRMLVKAGSTLLVPRNAQRDRDVPEHLADTASLSLAPDAPALRRVSLKAGRGETVATLARRYGVSSEQVAAWNKVGTQAGFKPGQRLVVYLPNTRTAARAATPTRVAHGSGGGRASVARSTTSARKPSRR